MLLDFAFPTGVSAQKLNLNSPYYEQKAAAEADLQKILWGTKNWRENMFTFTMDSSSLQGEEANGFESEAKCWFVCVTFDQILEM